MKRFAVLLSCTVLLAACTGADPIVTSPSASPTAPMHPATSPSAEPSPSDATTSAKTLTPIKTQANTTAFTTHNTCDELLGRLKAQAIDVVDAYGLPNNRYTTAFPGENTLLQEIAAEFSQAEGMSAADAPRDGSSGNNILTQEHSTTNVQEAGVGEFTNTVTNGRIIASVAEGIGSIDGPSGTNVYLINPENLETLGVFKSGNQRYGFKTSIAFADEQSLLVLEQESRQDGNRTILSRVSIANPSAPTVTSSLRINGYLNGARLVDGKVVLATTAEPQGLNFVEPTDKSVRSERDAWEKNKQIIQQSTINQWLADAEVVDGSGKPVKENLTLTNCDQIALGEGNQFALTSVFSVDPGQETLILKRGAAVVGQVQGVYASPDRLVAWTSDFRGHRRLDNQLITFNTTKPEAITLGARGAVEGYIPGSWAVDEAGGIIRVASTIRADAGEPVSQVTVFQEQGEDLAPVGRLEGLGKDEEIKAIRWLTPELGVMVTFKQTDPVYTIDTTDPANPKKAGELKIPGYSAYLHPVGDGRLLGIGQHADPATGRPLGFKYSLFDITDLSAPKELDTREFAGANSSAEYDHQAFTWYKDRGYVAIANHESSEGDDGVFDQLVISGVKVTNDKLDLLGKGTLKTNHAYTGAQTVVIGDRLFAVNFDAIGKYHADTITEEKQRMLP